MATGQQFNSKEELITEIKKKIFKNGQNLIDGEAVQKAFLDVVESLWGQGGSDTLVYTNSAPHIDIVTTLYNNNEVTSIIKISDYFLMDNLISNPSLPVIEYLPKGFGNMSRFDLISLRTWISSGANPFGFTSGFFNFNKLITEEFSENIALQGSLKGHTSLLTNDDNSTSDANLSGGGFSLFYNPSRSLPDISLGTGTNLTFEYTTSCGNLRNPSEQYDVTLILKGQLI